MIRSIFRKIRSIKFTYKPLVEVLIYKDRLLNNLHVFQNTYKIPIAPVLKSNAYGHGLIPIAKILEKENIPLLCVDSFYEALLLKNEKIKKPILILGYTPFHTIQKSSLSNVSFGIISMKELEYLSKNISSKIKIHLEINTGMNRHGISFDQIEKAILLLKENSFILLEGIYSHLAEANKKSTLTTLQIERWNTITKLFEKKFSSLRYIHLSATDGSIYSPLIRGNLIRLGIGLYGISSLSLPLTPVLELQSSIDSISTISSKESIGYEGTFISNRLMHIATIPLGYFEGVDRRLSNKGAVLIGNTWCPILGRISMNITTIDISKISYISIGEKVIVISKEKEAKNSIEEIAKLCQTIPYEILIHIAPHLRRIVI